MSRRRKPVDMTVYPDSTLGERVVDAAPSRGYADHEAICRDAGERHTARVEAAGGKTILGQIEARFDVVCRKMLEEEDEHKVAILKRGLIELAFAIVIMRQPQEGEPGPVAAKKWAKTRIKEVRAAWLGE